MNKKVLFIVIAVVLVAALLIFGLSASKEEVEQPIETQQPVELEESPEPVETKAPYVPSEDKGVVDNPFLDDNEPTPSPVVTPQPTPIVLPDPTPVILPDPTPVATPSPTPVATAKPSPTAAPVPTEKPEDNSTDQTVTAYEAYSSMSGQQQMEFMNSFGSMEQFFAWYNNARAEYEALHPSIEIGSDGVIGPVGN